MKASNRGNDVIAHLIQQSGNRGNDLIQHLIQLNKAQAQAQLQEQAQAQGQGHGLSSKPATPSQADTRGGASGDDGRVGRPASDVTLIDSDVTRTPTRGVDRVLVEKQMEPDEAVDKALLAIASTEALLAPAPAGSIRGLRPSPTSRGAGAGVGALGDPPTS